MKVKTFIQGECVEVAVYADKGAFDFVINIESDGDNCDVTFHNSEGREWQLIEVKKGLIVTEEPKEI